MSLKSEIKKGLKKLKELIKNYLAPIAGTTSVLTAVGCASVKEWDKCTKSSNWAGSNAQQRMMNILSPRMPDGVFNERLNFIKSRNCNTVNVFVCNKADGEYGGYSIYGNKFDWNIDKNYANTMLDRIKKLQKKGYGVVLWLAADDSSAWNKTMISNPQKYVNDLDSLGFFEYASTIVIGLEADEYWSSGQCSAMYNAIKSKYKGKVGIHQTSDKYNYAGCADIMFLQVAPSTSASSMQNLIKKAKGTGKPICMFECDRHENRSKCEAAFSAGAFSVGNW